MRPVSSADDWADEIVYLAWLNEFPWTQWYINHLRKKDGLAPFRQGRPLPDFDN